MALPRYILMTYVHCVGRAVNGFNLYYLSLCAASGITAFWKGNIPAQTLSIVYGGIQFYGFEYTKNTLYPNRNDLMSNFIW